MGLRLVSTETAWGRFAGEPKKTRIECKLNTRKHSLRILQHDLFLCQCATVNVKNRSRRSFLFVFPRPQDCLRTPLYGQSPSNLESPLQLKSSCLIRCCVVAFSHPTAGHPNPVPTVLQVHIQRNAFFVKHRRNRVELGPKFESCLKYRKGLI